MAASFTFPEVHACIYTSVRVNTRKGIQNPNPVHVLIRSSLLFPCSDICKCRFRKTTFFASMSARLHSGKWGRKTVWIQKTFWQFKKKQKNKLHKICEPTGQNIVGGFISEDTCNISCLILDYSTSNKHQTGVHEHDCVFASCSHWCGEFLLKGICRMHSVQPWNHTC